MPYSRPTLTDLINRTADDVVSRLTNPDQLRRSLAVVYARVLAGLAHGLYGAIDFLAAQLIYDTATSEWLRRWASIWGVTPKTASFATGTATVTGSNGAPIVTGTVWRALDGQLYESTADTSISSGTATVALIAQSAGAAGNRITGQTFTLVSPVAGVDANAVASAFTGGADAEIDDALLSRFLKRLRQPPQGGAKSDYEEWALAVPGVTRAWPSPLELGAGTVVLRFMMDDTYTNGIPLSGDVATVQAHIEPLRPVTAAVTVAAPIAAPLDFVFASLDPNTLANRQAIQANLLQLIKGEAQPGGTLLLSHIRAAISGVVGENDYALTSPSSNVTVGTSNITTLGTITWP